MDANRFNSIGASLRSGLVQTSPTYSAGLRLILHLGIAFGVGSPIMSVVDFE
jgi:hypothetical protein